jgi:hypothetical protein
LLPSRAVFFIFLLLLGLGNLGSAGIQTGQAAGATIITSVSLAVPLEKVDVSGTGFKPKETIRFYWGGTLLSTTARADATGAFIAAHVPIPANSGSGNGTIVAQGKTSGLSATAIVDILAPTLTVTPQAVVPGRRFTLEGTGFGAHEILTFSWDGAGLIGSAVVNGYGALGKTQVYVPGDAAPGNHVLLVRGETTARSFLVTMSVAPTGTPATPAPVPTPPASVGPAMAGGTYHLVGALVPPARAPRSPTSRAF